MRSLKFLSIMCVVLIACDPEAITEIPMNPPRIVVQSQPEAGGQWEVFVSHTLPLLDTMTSYFYPPPAVPNATVKLFDGETFVEDLVATGPESEIQKFVGSSEGPIPGHTYSIKVEAPGFESVSAHYVHPPAVSLDDVTFQLIRADTLNWSIDFDQIQFEFSIDVTFTDPPEDNYYYVAFLRANSPDLKTATYVSQEYLASQLADYQNQSNEGGSFLNDKKFAGKQTTLKFNTFFMSVIQADSIDAPYLFISLRNFSKELYDYRTFLTSPGPSYYDPYAQPGIVKSNVQNGLGVFAGYTADTRSYYIRRD